MHHSSPMSSAASITLSHQMALQNQMDVIANNIANSSTAGYQGSKTMFVEFLSKAVDGTPVAYVNDIAVLRDVSAGPLSQTSNPLDVAINGEGYFVVETEEGLFYTRNGSFRIDADGQLATNTGAAVMAEGDLPIVFAPDETQISISRDGTISTENGQIGRLQIVTFDNQQDMEKVGNTLLTTEQEPLQAVEASVEQGMLEGSNIKAVVEITEMIKVMRAYQGAAQLIQSEDERQRRALQTLTRPV